MSTPSHRLTRHDWGIVAGIALLGLALRIAAARGGPWLDEAWSAVMAREVATPAGVFLSINHDNSHHLNTLWLQFVGFGAPPLVARALSIASGTIAIVLAAQIGASRCRLMAMLAAFGFAISPILVTIGSEARGYALMVLALLSAILLVQRAQVEDDMRSRARAIAIAFGLGIASQLTMVYGICAIAGWVFVAGWRRAGLPAALNATFRLLGPGLIVAALFIAFVFGAAQAAGTGFQFGEYKPFDTLHYLHGLIELAGYTIGLPVISLWLLPAVLIALILAAKSPSDRFALYFFAILAFPLGILAVQAVNPGFARYYLLSGVALILLLAELGAAAIARGGWQRGIAIIGILGFGAGSTIEDLAFIRSQRGDPTGIIRALAARSPNGTRLMYDRASATAMLDYAAANQRYRLKLAPVGCPAASYVLLDRGRGESFPSRYRVCGAMFIPVAQRFAHGLSGMHWTLYARAR